MPVLLSWAEVIGHFAIADVMLPVHLHVDGTLHPVVDLRRHGSNLCAFPGTADSAPLTADAIVTLYRASECMTLGMRDDSALALVNGQVLPIAAIWLLQSPVPQRTERLAAMVCLTRSLAKDVAGDESSGKFTDALRSVRSS
jgi:hypothetical protein